MDQKVHIRLKTETLTLLGIALGATSLIGASPSAPVTFSSSSRTNSVVMPSALEQDLKYERLKSGPGRIKSSDDSPEISTSMPAVPGEGVNVFRNKKLQEWIDQQSNWIFINEPAGNKFFTSEGMQDKLDASFSGNNGRSKLTIDKYFESLQKDQNPSDKKLNGKNLKSTASELNENSNSLLPDDNNSSSKAPNKSSLPLSDFNNRSLDSKLDPGKLPINQGVDLGAIPEVKESLSSLYRSGMMSSREERLYQEHLQSERNFYQMLHPGEKLPASLLPSGQNDPINQMVDTSRSSVQPVTAPTMDELDATGKSRGSGIFNASANLPQSRSTSYNDMLNAKVFGSSSLSPTAINPAPSSYYVQPKPAILEIPKRKF